jgi:hypothetical protein
MDGKLAVGADEGVDISGRPGSGLLTGADGDDSEPVAFRVAVLAEGGQELAIRPLLARTVRVLPSGTAPRCRWRWGRRSAGDSMVAVAGGEARLSLSVAV